MERRLKRDQERVHSYHVDLYEQSRQTIEDKLAKGHKEEEVARERLRLSAVEREHKAKIADLSRKYAVTIEAKPAQMIKISAPVIRSRECEPRGKPLNLRTGPQIPSTDPIEERTWL